MNCETCEAPLQYRQEYCSQCGSPISWGNPYASPSARPALKSWKTSTGFSILGLLASNGLIALLGFSVLNIENPIVKIGGLFLSAAVFVQLIGMFVYPAFIYPTFFKEKPVFRSPKLISFLNFFFGGVFVVLIPISILFPLFWNKNLTIRKKGISPMVFSIIIITSLIIDIVWIATMISAP